MAASFSPLLLVVLLPFIGGLLASFLSVNARNTAAGMSGAISVFCFIVLALLYPQIAGGGKILFEIPWFPSLELNLIFRLDGLSWLFAMMVLGIGALVSLYARYYMSDEDPVPRFFSFLLAFMGSMLGVVLSGNLIQLVFFWELTSFFSFLLIGYWHHNQSARDGARIALVITGAGGICLLIGVMIIGRMVGSYDLDVVLASRELIQADPLYTPALILILLGAFTKSAQFPFQFWLPHAMSAPTPVSAFLHSATLVKAGIFILIRFWPVLSGTDEWHFIVGSVGLLTLLIGAWAAMFQHDLKGLLAYSTISHLGLITLLLGMDSRLAAVAAIFHTVNHATFKASLFMAAGIIDHETGTRDIRHLSGLYKFMPITATLAMVAAAAMAGVPLLNGFISKEMFLAEALETRGDSLLDQSMPYLATLASTFAVLYSIRFIHQVFFGPAPVDLPRQPHEAPVWMRLPIEILVLACLVVGIVPAFTIGPFLASAVQSVMGADAPYYSLAVWHGFSQPLFLSITALVSGSILYLIFKDRLKNAKRSPVVGRVRGRRTFEAIMALIAAGSRWLNRVLGSEKLQTQLRLVVLIAIVAGFLPFLAYGYTVGSEGITPLDPAFGAMWLTGGACAIAAAWLAKYHRVAALILVGGAGLVTCLTFFWLSAPDLGLTQLLVEIATTVLLLLSLRWLPKRLPELWGQRMPIGVWFRRSFDIGIAIAAGLGMSLLSFAVLTRPIPNSISRFFTEHAYSDGGGTNVVNVILVDFRGFDTFGEITVLAIVALTVFSLLRRFRPAPESIERPIQQRLQSERDLARDARNTSEDGSVRTRELDSPLMVPQLIIEWLFPIGLMLSIFLLIRGHDLPGGGFAAGITMSLTILLQYLARGTRSVESRLDIRPLNWIGAGLLLAGLTGAGAGYFGFPFLTSHFRYVELPIIGEIPAATALLFDIGVFLLVVGATVLMLIAIAHQSIRSPRTILPKDTPTPEEKK